MAKEDDGAPPKAKAKRRPYKLTVSLALATPQERTELSRQGVPGYLHRVPPYPLYDVVRRFGVQRRHGHKSLTKMDQMAHARAVFRGDEPFVACVSSEINDARAKLFGAYAMLRWMRDGLGPSVWHAPHGGASDSLRDRPRSDLRSAPSQLVLANVDNRMTHRKREKVRDLLEAHADGPCLVAATGGHPVDVMNHIGIHCHLCVWIRSVDSWDLG